MSIETQFVSTIRSNKQIWRIAEYISTQFNSPVVPWRECSEGYRNECYDETMYLLKKLNNNEFTGGDDHKD